MRVSYKIIKINKNNNNKKKQILSVQADTVSNYV